jgi:hypothetical protein
MVMALSALLNLKSRQVDYMQAFPQAPLDDDVFMKILQGWQYNSSAKKLVQNTNDCGLSLRVRASLHRTSARYCPIPTDESLMVPHPPPQHPTRSPLMVFI